MFNFALVSYVLQACFRDRIMIAFATAFAVIASVSTFLGSAAVTEKDQFALVFAAGSLRLACVMGIVLFITFFIRRSFESRDVEFLLSRPVSKYSLIFSYALAFYGLCVFMVGGVALCLTAMGADLSDFGNIMWLSSVLAELLIMAVIAFFFSVMLASATVSVLAVLAFYILGRLMGQLLSIVDTHQIHTIYSDGIEFTMMVVSVLMPRLDLMGQTSWLIYGYSGDIDIFYIVTQVVIYSALIIAALLYDIYKKQF